MPHDKADAAFLSYSDERCLVKQHKNFLHPQIPVTRFKNTTQTILSF